MKGGDRPKRLLPYAKMLLVPKTFFSLLLGRLCPRRVLVKTPISHLRGHATHIDLLWFFVSGRQDLPSDARAYSLKQLKLFITAE